MTSLQAGRELIAHALTGAAAPAVVSALVLGVARLLARRGSELARRAGPALAVGLGYAAGHAALQGWPPLAHDLSIRQWPFWLALVLAAGGVVEGLAPRGALAWRTLLAILAPYLLLRFQRELHWTRAEGVVWTTGLAVLLLWSWTALARAERLREHAAPALGLACAEALAAAAYLASGSQTLAQAALALALAAGVAALWGLRGRAAGLGASGLGAFLLLHHALLWCARFVSDLGWTAFGLLAAAPLAAAIPRGRGRRVAWLVALGPLLLAGLALLLELRDQPEGYGSPGGYGR